MKGIIGCEESQEITIACREVGIEAYSCDLKPCSGGHPEWHIQDNILNHLDDGWDFGVFHPVCKYLANSGVRWRVERQEWEQIRIAADFFNTLYHAEQIPKRMVENPIQHKYARALIKKYDQLIQPWQFGDNESKATCLWLVDIPELIPIITEKPENVKQSCWKAAPSKHREADRSRTFPGVANGIVNAILRAG